MKRQTIATDVDGVLLSWQSGLPYFAQKYNLPLDHILEMIQNELFLKPGELFGCDDELGSRLIEKYNCSDFIRYLAPYMDALRAVNTLKSRFDFIAVTALGDSIDARLNRQFNLNALFPDAFKEIFMCGHNHDKKSILRQAKEKYDIRFFVDDLPSHCEDAINILNCPVYWMLRSPREGFSRAIKVKSWDDIIKHETAKDRLSADKTSAEKHLELHEKGALGKMAWVSNSNGLSAVYKEI